MGKWGNFKSGDVYGKLMLTGKSYMELDKVNPKRKVEWICECGKTGWALLSNILRKSKSKSCGCQRKNAILEGITSHNLSKHHLYKIWNGIKRRCYRPEEISYPDYGAKGVVMCEEWLNSFQSFYDWAISNGWEKGLQIDKDKLAPTKTGSIYCPEFCCFLTRKENMRHRRDTIISEYMGVKKPLREWCELFNRQFGTVLNRINNYKWSVKDALETEVNSSRKNREAKC